MKRSFLIVMLVLFASIAFAQGTKGQMYFNKELGKWLYLNNTDSTEIRWQTRLCYGDGCPFQAAASSGSVPTVSISTTNRTAYYTISGSGGASTVFHGITQIDYKLLFPDTLKHWFGNRALAQDTCLMVISSRRLNTTMSCSLFVYNYGANNTDTLFRVALRTTNVTGYPLVCDTTYFTFETAAKDSNSQWPIKFPNGFILPCIYYQFKIVTQGTNDIYYLYSFRILTDWRNH